MNLRHQNLGLVALAFFMDARAVFASLQVSSAYLVPAFWWGCTAFAMLFGCLSAARVVAAALVVTLAGGLLLLIFPPNGAGDVAEGFEVALVQLIAAVVIWEILWHQRAKKAVPLVSLGAKIAELSAQSLTPEGTEEEMSARCDAAGEFARSMLESVAPRDASEPSATSIPAGAAANG